MNKPSQHELVRLRPKNMFKLEVIFIKIPEYLSIKEYIELSFKETCNNSLLSKGFFNNQYLEWTTNKFLIKIILFRFR